MKKIEDSLQIILVTYNRLEKLKSTMTQLLDDKSPVRRCSITVLDNKSTDGTSKYIDSLCKKHKNLVHIVHSRNIGGNANIARAFEIASMKYLWVLCDDDEYDFTHWDEIESAILEDEYDCILTERKVDFTEKDLPYIINTLAFVPAGIYKTANITDTVMVNMEANIMYSFPHLMLGCHLLNINAKFCVPKHTVITQIVDFGFARGTDAKELHFRQRTANVFSGYVNSFQMIVDKELRKKCCDVLWIGEPFSKSARMFLLTNGWFFPNIFDFFYCIRNGRWHCVQFIFIFLRLFIANFVFGKIKNLFRRVWNKFMVKFHIIWDLDGTLVDSEQEIFLALEKAAREAGVSKPIEKASFNSKCEVDEMIRSAFGDGVLSSRKRTEIAALFQENYDHCRFYNTIPFKGIEKILANKFFTHHIVTDKPNFATGGILSELGLEKYFRTVITPYSYMDSPCDKKKTKAELFAICMGDYPKNRFVGIGDTGADASAARAVGIPAIGVLWGTGTKEELQAAGCDEIAETVEKLKKVLEAL